MTRLETQTGVPAAWYPDPKGPPLLRWWDGTSWTAQTVDPRAVAATPDARVETPETPETPAYVPMAGYVANPNRRATYVWLPQAKGSPHTAAIWFFALYPAIQTVVSVIISFFVESAGGTYPQIALGGASIVAALVLCKSDSATLRERGYQPPGWGWGLLPLVYLIMRTMRVGKASLWPLFAWVGVQAVFIVIILLAVAIPVVGALSGNPPLTTTERAAQLTPAGMQERLGADLTAASYEVTGVVCPPLGSMAGGTQVECQVETPTAILYVTVEVSPDETHTAFVVVGGKMSEK